MTIEVVLRDLSKWLAATPKPGAGEGGAGEGGGA